MSVHNDAVKASALRIRMLKYFNSKDIEIAKEKNEWWRVAHLDSVDLAYTIAINELAPQLEFKSDRRNTNKYKSAYLNEYLEKECTRISNS